MSQDDEQSLSLSTLDMIHYPQRDSTPEYLVLREKVLKKQRQEIIDRFTSNPIPDSEEIAAGAFREEIEPQCREAIFLMRRKGHNTYSSGFGTNNRQVVDGIFDFREDTIRALRENDFEILSTTVGGKPVQIIFEPNTTNLQEITNMWNKLAEILPYTEHPAPVHTQNIEEFTNEFRRNNAHLFH